MFSSRRGFTRLYGANAVLTLAVLAACTPDRPVGVQWESEGVYAKGGGGGSGPTVRSAVPDTGLRGTTIDVRILGSDFDNGSQAVWAIDGDTTFATTKVMTNSTRFVKSGELVANITIAADAPLELFDIVVRTAGGKNGIGIELFSVKSPGPYNGYSAQFDDGVGMLVRSDGAGAYFDDGPDYLTTCVHSAGSGGGFYQLRTIANTGYCKALQRPAWRWVTLDLGTPSLDFDQDGMPESIESVPARLLFPDALANRARSTGARILVLVVNPDGSTTQDQKYELAYRTSLLVTDLGNGTRVIATRSGDDVVDVYGAWTHGEPTGPILATFSLPMRLTIMPQ
jgi:hypothetical protein